MTVIVIVIFQCEDERFELDMVIEAGSSAINLLEPMADEIKAIDNTAGVRSEEIVTSLWWLLWLLVVVVAVS